MELPVCTQFKVLLILHVPVGGTSLPELALLSLTSSHRWYCHYHYSKWLDMVQVSACWHDLLKKLTIWAYHLLIACRHLINHILEEIKYIRAGFGKLTLDVFDEMDMSNLGWGKVINFKIYYILVWVIFYLRLLLQNVISYPPFTNI